MERDEDTEDTKADVEVAVSDDQASKKQQSVLDELVLGGQQVIPASSSDSRFSSSGAIQMPSLSDISSRRRQQTHSKSRGENLHNVSPILKDQVSHHRRHQQHKQNGGLCSRQYKENPTLIDINKPSGSMSRIPRQTYSVNNPVRCKTGLPNPTIKTHSSHNDRGNTVKSMDYINSSFDDADLYAQRIRIENQHQKQLQYTLSSDKLSNRKGCTAIITTEVVAFDQNKKSTEVPKKYTKPFFTTNVLRTLPLQSELEQFQKVMHSHHTINQSFTKYVKASVSGDYHPFRGGGPINRPRNH